MSTRSSIYYSHEDNIHIYLGYMNGMVCFDLPGFFYSLPAKTFLAYVKAAKGIMDTADSLNGLDAVENYVRNES